MESCIYIYIYTVDFINIYIYIYCIYNIRTYICSYKVWIIDLSITSLSWFDHYIQHILCQLSGIQKAGGHQHSMGDLLGQMWMGSFLPSFWFVRSTRIYWVNRCQLEPSSTRTLVPAFNCTESEMLLFFQAFSPWFHHSYCVGTCSDSTNKCQRRHPSALPHFSQRCMDIVLGIEEVSARALAWVANEFEVLKVASMAVNGLTTLLMGLAFFQPCCGDTASTIWLFTDSLCEGEPQVLNLEGACEQVTVGSTTYYGRGDCHTLKQGSLRLCFDKECQECQDFPVRSERECGDVGLHGLNAEWACAQRAPNFLAQNQSGFMISDASSVGIHTTVETSRTKPVLNRLVTFLMMLAD